MKARRKLRASSLYSDSLEDFGYEESDTGLINHQRFGDILVDPDENDYMDGGFTHSPTLARLKASIDDTDDLDDDLLDDMPEDDIDSLDADLLDDEDEGVYPVELLSAEDGSQPEPPKEDVEKALEHTEDPNNNESDVQREGEPVAAKKANKVKAEEETSLMNNQGTPAMEVDSSFEYNLVDVDCVGDDCETDDLVFASIKGTKHVIHSGRIIASLDADGAEMRDISDVYLDDDFDEAVVSEVAAKGLRAGLRSMGFTLAKVKMKASAQVKASVARTSSQVKASMIEAQAKKDKIMHDCFALAAVGLNRNLFKDHQNTLRSDLVARFENLGVRGASRIVKAAFQEHGVTYASTLMTLANSIADLPEDSREGLSAQLDMTTEPDDEIMADPNLYGDPVTSEEDDDDAVDSVEAALRNPIKASVQKQKLSATVKDTLPFAIY